MTEMGTVLPRHSRHPLARDIQIYRVGEFLSEVLIYSMVVFSPWAFGSTDDWAVRVMNGGGYILGLLLAIKLAVRARTGYQPPRWDTGNRLKAGGGKLKKALVGLTFAVPAYCLVAALNARSTYRLDLRGFDYHPSVGWLPSSLESASTWFVFWCALGLACSFWALRDWLLGKSTDEIMGGKRGQSLPESGPPPGLPKRWRRLLWLLSLNGGILGVEGIVQRLANNPKLLFLVLPAIHQTAETQFGPYAYRSNAAQYFNLLWPATLGFWWVLGQNGGTKSPARHLLLLCAAIMAACPIISTSRGGALVAAGQCLVATAFLLAGEARRRRIADRAEENDRAGIGPLPAKRWRWAGAAPGIFLIASLSLGFSLGWGALKPRMAKITEGYRYRERMYQFAEPMAADYPVYGIGPGAFVYVFQLYRMSTSTYWPPELHNDWLETRISFGWAGSAIIALALALVALRWFVPDGLAGSPLFTAMLWLAAGGCLIHARFDFPFQVYSVVFLFLVWCAMLATLSRPVLRSSGRA